MQAIRSAGLKMPMNRQHFNIFDHKHHGKLFSVKMILRVCPIGVAILTLAIGVCSGPQLRGEKIPVNALNQIEVSLEKLAPAVAPAVVQINAAGYIPLSDDNTAAKKQTFSKQNIRGSGIIVEGSGYIVTAFHVIKGAKRIRVEVTPGANPQGAGLSYPASIVGFWEEADVAVLKIDAHNLPTLTLFDSDNLKQGQLVVGFGNAEGMPNSMSLGVVSSGARRVDDESSMVYVQTDISLAQGSSGGPLVDLQGRMVGMNVFNVTDDGGAAEGLAFAVPGAIVRLIYLQIRKYGSFHRASMGISVQKISGVLASGLHLPSDRGVIIEDVKVSSPADQVGVHEGDVILSIDGKSINDASQFFLTMLHKLPGDHLKLNIARNRREISFDIVLVAAPEEISASSMVGDIDKDDIVSELGILGSEIGDRKLPSPVRSSTGVIVQGLVSTGNTGPNLELGDIIRSVNGDSVSSVKSLRGRISNLKSGDAVVLQVEREGKLRYVAFEME